MPKYLITADSPEKFHIINNQQLKEWMSDGTITESDTIYKIKILKKFEVEQSVCLVETKIKKGEFK